MKKVFLITGFWLLVAGTFGQTVSQKLQKAFQQFTNDAQLKHAISSLYVIDAKTGKVVFDKNSQVGLAGASTQKIITATTAFELLGKDYRYKTEFGIADEMERKYLYVLPAGDPTFGSWRWGGTNSGFLFEKIKDATTKENLKFSGLVIGTRLWNKISIPDGWIWQDIGNYYGAAATELNWRENQFDLLLKSGNKIGDSVAIVGTVPLLYSYNLTSIVTAANKSSGDNAYIYFGIDPKMHEGVVTGTIPVGENNFKISGALPFSEHQFAYTIVDSLKDIFVSRQQPAFSEIYYSDAYVKYESLYTHYSPSLDSIIYWFLKKSINLYGEALIKTFAYEKKGFGSTDSGVAIVKDFWKQKGLDDDELNICDGSGLSPLNRVTTHVQVEVLKYAKTRDWFPYFYDALPEYNNMKMKSGTISGVKGFTGYQTSKSGNEYIFSFLVNNYNGSPSALVDKMYKVLNVLK